jgi:hypothetical protein
MTFFEKSGITYPRQRYIPDTRDTWFVIGLLKVREQEWY